MHKIAKLFRVGVLLSLIIGCFAVATQAAIGDISAHIPQTFAAPGSIFSLPVFLTGEVAGSEVLSAEFVMGYDGGLLEVLGVSKRGTLTEDWGDPTVTITPGKVRVSMPMGAGPLEGAGILLFVRFRALYWAGPSDPFLFHLEEVLLNEAFIETQDGSGARGSEEIKVRIPHILASPGDTLSVPILVSDVTQDSVLSAKASVLYDAPWLTNPSLSTNGTLINDWGFKESNLVHGNLQMAAASATPLLGAGVLVFIHFVVDPSAEPGSYADLILEDVLFNEGVPSAAIQWGSISVTTLRPTADFGVVSTGVTARFTDLSTGPNAIVAWSWSFGDGTTSALQHPVHAYVNKQAYTVHLTVTDEGGISDTVTRGILLNDRPVITSMGPDTTDVEIDEGESVVFEVEAFDPEGDPLTYRWFVDGTDQGEIGSSFTVVSNFVPPRSSGVYAIEASVSDPGGTADTTWVLTIRDVPQNPVVAGIPDQTIQKGQRFSPFDLDGYVKDVDSDPKTLTWQDSGAVDITVIIEENTHIVTLTAPTGWTGSEQITFVATDPEGLKGADVMTASVRADERGPQILTGPVAVGVTDREAVIFWTTDEPSDGHVAYGLELG
ncbi:MAG: PKD domain-containing protein, partial [Candidatus Latescibacterota bacterium]